MTFGEFLQNNGIAIETQLYTMPKRYTAKLVKPPLSITITLDKVRTEVIGMGATPNEAIVNLFDNCKGKQIRLKGWIDNEYIDTKLKVPNDIELQGLLD